MSMKNYLCSGYLLPLSSFYKLFSADDVSLLEVTDVDNMEFSLKMLQNVCTQAGLPVPTDIVIVDETGDIDENLEYDTPYVYFGEESLYKKVPTKELTKLKKDLDIAPTMQKWSVYA